MGAKWQSCSQVLTLFNALKDGFKQYINEQATWMADEATRTTARQKIDAMTAAVGYASIAFDDARLDDYYETVRIDSIGTRCFEIDSVCSYVFSFLWGTTCT